jgi:uncharacterized membrane protein
MESLAKILLGLAVALALVGGLMLLASRLGIGRLPGDILVRRGNFTFYVPVGLMVALSLLATVILNVLLRR